jgi:membrane-associated phospholipid phosphatase
MMVRRAGLILPRGWGDFFFQLALWLGFGLAYQVARGIADRGPLEAFENGRLVIDTERALHSLVEADLQRVVIESGGWLLAAVNWTYWLAQFVVLGLALLWIYIRHNGVFPRVRNWVLGTNMVALIGYVLMPTAPPRFFAEEGFVDTLARSASVNHGSGLIELAANPYAAMPSIHAADALIIGFAMAMLVRSRWARVAWTLWPTWVWFTVMATGNHFWLDVAAGAGVAFLSATLLAWIEGRAADDRISAALARSRCS